MNYKNTPQLAGWLREADLTVLAGFEEFILDATQYQTHIRNVQTRPANEQADAAAFRCLTTGIKPETPKTPKPEQILIQQDQILKAYGMQVERHHATIGALVSDVGCVRAEQKRFYEDMHGNLSVELAEIRSGFKAVEDRIDTARGEMRLSVALTESSLKRARFLLIGVVVLLAFLLLFTIEGYSQSPPQLAPNNVYGQTVTITSAGTASTAVSVIDSGITSYKFACYPIGTVTTAGVTLQTSEDNSTWATAISSVDCSNPNQASATTASANYVRINATTFSGSGSVHVTWRGYIDRVGVSGPPAPGCTANDIAYFTAAFTLGCENAFTYNPSTNSFLLSSTSATAMTVGPNGLTNPAFQIAANTASAATGLLLTAKAAGDGVTLASTSSGSDELIQLDPKGLGFTQLGPDTFGVSGWGGIPLSVEVYRASSSASYTNEVYIESHTGDVASSSLDALGVVAGTQGGGATQNITGVTGIFGAAFNQLPSGRTLSSLFGLNFSATANGGGTTTLAGGLKAAVVASSSSTITAGAAAILDVGDMSPSNNTSTAYGARVTYTGITKTTTATYAYHSADMAGISVSPYFAWSDSPGVFNVAGDGKLSYHNPGFATKYTPALANYERVVIQWTSNEAEVGTEAGGTGTQRALRLLGSGVTHGSTLPTGYTFWVNAGTSGLNGRVYAANLTTSTAAQTAYMCMSSTGEMIELAVSSNCATSSARFKNSISYDDVAGLSTVLQMKPASFVYNNEGFKPELADNSRHYGFIAEDVAEIDTRLVNYDRESGLVRGVQYEMYTAVLTKAIQEQYAEIQDLKYKVAQLELAQQ